MISPTEKKQKNLPRVRNTVVSLAAYRLGEEARLSRYNILVLSSIIICYFTHTRIYMYYLLIFRCYKVLEALIHRDMGEVLAIGASVIAIVQITDRIVGLCKFYIETVNDAPSDFRLILLETSTLKTIFESLSFLKACDSGVSNILSGLASVDGPIEGCLKSVTQLEKLFPSNWQQITEQCRSKKRKVKATLAALAWPLKEGKARKLLDEISRYKTSITLALTTESGSVVHSLFQFFKEHL